MAKIKNREIIPIINSTMSDIQQVVGKKLTQREISQIQDIITRSYVELSNRNFKSAKKIIHKRGYEDED